MRALVGLILPAICLGLVELFAVRTNSDTDASNGFTSATLKENFGLSAGGQVRISSDVSDSEERVLFNLFSHSQWDSYQALVAQKDASQICLAPAAMRYETSGGNSTVHFTARHTDQYTLQITYCRQREFTVSGTFKMYNVNGGEEEHLPLGQETSVQLFKVLLCCYGCLVAVFVVRSCAYLRAHVLSIHFGCALALLAKLLETLARYMQLGHMSRFGVDNASFTMATTVLEGISGILFLAVLLLISLGWTLMRDRLTNRENKLAFGVFGSYVTVASAKLFCGSDTQACSAYLLTEYVIRSLIMLGIIVAMNFNIQQLRSSLHIDRWNSSSTPKLYGDLEKYQAFRWAFIAYLLLPTLLLILKITILSWKYEWVNDLLNELLLLGIYVHVGVTFDPIGRCRYMQIANLVSDPPRPAAGGRPVSIELTQISA